MKKNIFLFICIIVFSSFVYGQKEQKNRAIKNGLFLNTSMGIYTSKIGLEISNYDWNEFSYANIQFGNRWYIKPQEKWALGIQNSWFDISFAEFTALTLDTSSFIGVNYLKSTKKIFVLSLLSVGPFGTYAIKPNIAIDCYYNIRPTYVKFNAPNVNDLPGFGFSHLCGISLRIGVFNIGCDYVFGDIKSLTDVISGVISDLVYNIYKEDIKATKTGRLKMDLVRLNLGVKF